MEHETVVVGWDESGNVIAVRTFHYDTEKEAAQAFLTQVQAVTKSWAIGNRKHLIITVDEI
jgi:O-acetylhomoserine/O-acetylserine sulfhydrylase-like pyridoxal-dependent enzyme